GLHERLRDALGGLVGGLGAPGAGGGNKREEAVEEPALVGGASVGKAGGDGAERTDQLVVGAGAAAEDLEEVLHDGVALERVAEGDGPRVASSFVLVGGSEVEPEAGLLVEVV